MDPTVIDFTPLIDTVVQYAVIAIGAVGTVFVAWLGKKANELFGLKIEDAHRKVLLGALDKAVEFGVSKARESYAGKTKLEVKNAAVALGATYALASVPTALKKFGIDPKTVEGEARVQQMIEARLSDWVLDEVSMEGQPVQSGVGAPVEAVRQDS